ncbi:hypothetical protein ACIGNX_07720 [Actinosynnema sp. NPDC053489]|uniref:hypothetical protein n=1 Tax=Actinosynnema sp. NPDC053489 TaxID=3363916 RepID=UPI0037CB915E
MTIRTLTGSPRPRRRWSSRSSPLPCPATLRGHRPGVERVGVFFPDGGVVGAFEGARYHRAGREPDPAHPGRE